MSKPVQLKRVLSLPVMIFYGTGTMIGAGIYVLIGKVGLVAGMHLPIAFLLSGVIAIFTALSYAELSSRFPFSSGAALYIQEAWHQPYLSQIVGWLIVLTGIVSAATMARGFSGYFQIFATLPPIMVLAILITLLALIAAWGIKESATLIVAITLIELGGLLFVVYAGWQGAPLLTTSAILVAPAQEAWMGIFLGAFLAFYAFIGFEDMVNVAEEIKNPRRNLPLAIIVSIATVTCLYVILAITVLRVMPADLINSSNALLADLAMTKGYSAKWMGAIGLIAILNGALVQIIMAARLIYGMGNKGLAPAFLATLHPLTRTPIVATILVALAVFVFSALLPLVVLAKITSFIMLFIFVLVNLALITLKMRGQKPEKALCFPMWVPIIGLVLCLFLILFQFV